MIIQSVSGRQFFGNQVQDILCSLAKACPILSCDIVVTSCPSNIFLNTLVIPSFMVRCLVGVVVLNFYCHRVSSWTWNICSLNNRSLVRWYGLVILHSSTNVLEYKDIIPRLVHILIGYIFMFFYKSYEMLWVLDIDSISSANIDVFHCIHTNSPVIFCQPMWFRCSH